MKLINKKIILLLMGIGVVLLMGACDVTCSFVFSDYSGKAVNVKAAGDSTDFWKDSDSTSSTATLEGAVISLYAYNSDNEAYETTAYMTATVTELGYFTFLSPIPGSYKVTGSKTGWTFVPRYIDISDNGAASQEIYAYPTVETVDGTDYEAEYTIIASWQNASMDVDLTLTYGDPGAATTLPWDTGYGATPDVNTRYRIYYGIDPIAGIGSRDCVYLNRDVKGDSASSIPRVETISIYSADWFYNGDVLKVYIDAPESDEVLTGNIYTGDGADSAASAYVQIDIMKGSDYMRTYYSPLYSNEDTIEVFDIEYDSNVFTFHSANSAVYLNDGSLNDGGIRSIIGE